MLSCPIEGFVHASVVVAVIAFSIRLLVVKGSKDKHEMVVLWYLSYAVILYVL